MASSALTLRFVSLHDLGRHSPWGKNALDTRADQIESLTVRLDDPADAIELLRFQVRQTWDWLDLTMSDVTEEHANWQPSGIANSIAASYAHTMIAADEDFNQVMAGGDMLIFSSWRDSSGLSELPPRGEWDWLAWSKSMQMDVPAFRRYAAAVRETVESWLERITPELLTQNVDMTQFGLGMWTGLDIFNLHVHHPRIHGGEIACIKGILGNPAWPTRPATT